MRDQPFDLSGREDVLVHYAVVHFCDRRRLLHVLRNVTNGVAAAEREFPKCPRGADYFCSRANAAALNLRTEDRFTLDQRSVRLGTLVGGPRLGSSQDAVEQCRAFRDHLQHQCVAALLKFSRSNPSHLTLPKMIRHTLKGLPVVLH